MIFPPPIFFFCFILGFSKFPENSGTLEFRIPKFSKFSDFSNPGILIFS